MSNLLLSPAQHVDPDRYVSPDRVFRREYEHHIIRLGTKDGKFFVTCEIDRYLFDLLSQSYDAGRIRELCEIADPRYTDVDMDLNQSDQFSDDAGHDPGYDTSYLLAPAYTPASNTPGLRTAQQCAQYLHTHTHVWYTGAGLSIAAGLPSMSELKSDLGIQNHLGISIDPCLHRLLTTPDQIQDSWMRFARQMQTCLPTPAHRAIRALVDHYHTNIVTENTDSLHQKTGIEPLMINDPEAFRAAIPPGSMREIDVLITVGLGSGDRGLVGYYKMHHPQGRVIAINTDLPAYCGPEDIRIAGDCQQIIPQILSVTQISTPS